MHHRSQDIQQFQHHKDPLYYPFAPSPLPPPRVSSAFNLLQYHLSLSLWKTSFYAHKGMRTERANNVGIIKIVMSEIP